MPDLAFTVGSVRAWLLDCGIFRYDGGLIFGAVPKSTWSAHYPPDEDNLVQVGLRPLLIQDGPHRTLVNTGLPPEDPGIPFDPPGHRPVSRALADLGVRAEQVSAVVLTHLHPDHIGGNLVTEDDTRRPAFPRARYLVQRAEAAACAYPNERTRADYSPEHLSALAASGGLDVLPGAHRVSPHVRLIPAPGHTDGHQVVRIEDGEETALYVSDLAIVPVQAERLAWISALDVEPMRTLESKRAILGQAVEAGTLLLFEHEPDPDRCAGYLEPSGKRWAFRPQPLSQL